MTQESLSRFRDAHQRDYATALAEIRAGRKQTHWMWYIFPQLRGLGRSQTADYYGLESLDEAATFLRDPYLGGHLREISSALLALDTRDAYAVFGRPDCFKLCSCMTLFSLVDGADPVFRGVIDAFYHGQPDKKTLSLLGLSDA